MENGYRVGSLQWIERNRGNEYRAILESLIAGEINADKAKAALYYMDTDSASS